ncbi:MAG: GHKL domain-containing protein [Deltaproteobacteria bacterium]|nr:GHKL domain-containing protein [Deltaproteobacteria bacterium]
MLKKTAINDINLEERPDDQRRLYYRKIFRKFIFLTILCSLVPLLLVGWAINVHYSDFANTRVMKSFQTRLGHHRQVIELFLRQRSSMLELIAHSHTKQYLSQAENLSKMFELINREKGSITDLGLIDENGRHLAYIGPYDLMNRNYSKTFWFKEVMNQGIFISDMFMGFRQEPHFVIAVTSSSQGKKWILRATVDSEAFRSLVENVRIGKTGEVYLLNQQGIFQTSSRFKGSIMEKAAFEMEPVHSGIKVRILEAQPANGTRHPRQVVSHVWLDEPKWLLVVKQDYAEAFTDVNHANYSVLFFLHLSALIILIVTVFITRHMINVIKQRDREADQLNRQLMQAGKLASIGQLSAGVAHEINNPLAIILTERQLLLDAGRLYPHPEPEFVEQLDDSMSQIDVQVQRCKRITQNLLRFARRTKSVIDTVNINSFLGEVIELMKREARSSGIKFMSDFDENIPPMLSDPSQLQQVFLNLITNAIDAHEQKPYGSVSINTKANNSRDGVNILIADTGSGITPENVDKIFDPFFTTKIVGKGTGLGLSICYSIIKRLGGEITLTSTVNEGTEFKIYLPYKPPAELIEAMEKGDGEFD